MGRMVRFNELRRGDFDKNNRNKLDKLVSLSSNNDPICGCCYYSEDNYE